MTILTKLVFTHLHHRSLKCYQNLPTKNIETLLQYLHVDKLPSKTIITVHWLDSAENASKIQKTLDFEERYLYSMLSPNVIERV